MEKSQKKYTGRLTPEQRSKLMGEAFYEAQEEQKKRELLKKAGNKKYTGPLTPERMAESMGRAFDKAREKQEKRISQKKAEAVKRQKQKLSRLKLRILRVQKRAGIPIDPKYTLNPLPSLKKRKTGK